jgi:LmbE family N-acetylglucosaminyl deacetylase
MFFPELEDEGYTPYKICQLYVHGGERPNLEIDITAVMEIKLKALSYHKSQFDFEKMKERFMKRSGEEQEDGRIRHFERYRRMIFREIPGAEKEEST